MSWKNAGFLLRGNRAEPHYPLSRRIESICSYYLLMSEDLSSDSVALAYVIICYDKVIVCIYKRFIR